MASYQRVALFVFFDAIEQDLVARLRLIAPALGDHVLNEEERKRASFRLQKRDDDVSSARSDFDLLHGLDLGDKIAILMRHKAELDDSARAYFMSKRVTLERCIPIRNAVMHGRPLTTEEYSAGFAAANEFLKASAYWPTLSRVYHDFDADPTAFVSASIHLLDDDSFGGTLNNLPSPDYDDTGFFPRPMLEADLKKKLLGRHPVITVLGEGGNGKSALALQTLYGLVESNDHDFDAIVWVSAKSARLNVAEIVRIEDAIADSVGLFAEVADLMEPGSESPIERVRKLLAENKVLLAIDNLETVLDADIKSFADDVPGESKLLFTSRVPLGADLSVNVDPFSPNEARGFLKRLAEAYDIDALKSMKSSHVEMHMERLKHKPLLVKWFALGVHSGLSAERITSQPEVALRYCMENVFEQLSQESKEMLSVLAAVPRPVSAGIVQYITNITAPTIERCLAELLRFALIQSSPGTEVEPSFQVKPFARAYITKVLRQSPAASHEIAARYRTIEATYQSEQGLWKANRYNPKTYVVRSRTEAIAAKRLRHIANLALKERFDEAYDLLQELRISNPGYFEVPRTEAFVAFRAGDAPRANDAYESALSLAPEQPQLRASYAGFLMRSYGDYPAAEQQFLSALEMDEESAYLLRECARNYFFMHEFERAQEMITRAWALKPETFKDEVVLTDLQAQVHVRAADHLVQKGDPRAALHQIIALATFLKSRDTNLFDMQFMEHVRKVLPTIEALQRSPALAGDRELERASETIAQVMRTSYGRAPHTVQPILFDERDEARTGTLKTRGRQETYGFLVDPWGTEYFVSRADVEAIVWTDMCRGRLVTFRVVRDNQGRTRATAVNLA